MDRGLEVSVGACSWATRVPAMRWGNAREVLAGPQGGTIADVCIIKKRLFFESFKCRKQCIAGPIHAGPFWVHLNIMKHAERRPNSTVAGKLANLVHQSPPQRFVVNVFMQMRANPILWCLETKSSLLHVEVHLRWKQHYYPSSLALQQEITWRT